MNDHAAKKLELLYTLYVKLEKLVFLHTLQRKRIGYAKLWREANRIYTSVHQMRADLEDTNISQDLKQFIEYFDLASGCLATYLSDRNMFDEGLVSRTQLNQDMKDHKYFNKLLIKASKKFE